MNDFSRLGCFPLLGNDAPSRASAEFMVSAFAEAIGCLGARGVDPWHGKTGSIWARPCGGLFQPC